MEIHLISLRKREKFQSVADLQTHKNLRPRYEKACSVNERLLRGQRCFEARIKV